MITDSLYPLLKSCRETGAQRRFAPDVLRRLTSGWRRFSRKVLFTFITAVAASFLWGEAPAAAQTGCQDTDIWCATLTTGASTGFTGYYSSPLVGSLSPTTFTYGGKTYTVSVLGLNSFVFLPFSMSPVPTNETFEDLTFYVNDNVSFAMNAGTSSSGFYWDATAHWADHSSFAGTHTVRIVAQTPEAPDAPTLDAGNAQIAVSWTAPGDGGSAITGYEVQWAPVEGTDPNWVQGSSADVTGTSHTIASLTNGTEYGVRVRAENALGDSNWSDHTTAKPSTVPAAPPKNNRLKPRDYDTDMYKGRNEIERSF